MIRFGLVWGWWFTCNVNLPWWYPSRTRRQYKSISSDGKRWRTSVAKCKYWPRVFCPPSLIRRKLVRNFTAATAATRRLIWTHCRPKFSHSPGLSALFTKVINPSCENLNQLPNPGLKLPSCLLPWIKKKPHQVNGELNPRSPGYFIEKSCRSKPWHYFFSWLYPIAQ